MSDQTAARHSALTLAVQLAAALGDRTDVQLEVIATAETFLAFLNNTDNLPLQRVVGAAEPATKRATKAAAPAKAASQAKVPAKAVAESEPEVDETGPTDKDIGDALGQMLAANKREEVVALLKQFGAKSKSTLDPKHYAAFLAGVEAALLDA